MPKHYYSNRENSIEEPNTCPYCHHAIQPKFLNSLVSNDFDKEYCLIANWECQNNPCKRIIITRHHWSGGYEMNLTSFIDGYPIGPNWPKPIQELRSITNNDKGEPVETKSKFIEIYLQSLKAESQGLFELAGMGYRKAIEFLVKDWAISKKSGDAEKIKSMWLSGIISEYFDGDLKDILDRATWLGNDQAHYIKLFQEYNLAHIKELIELIMVELDREYKKRMYIENIEKRK